MTYNSSLDFLNMIKNSKNNTDKPVISLKRTFSQKRSGNYFAVIDTETNWNNDVMSIGVALADAESSKCVDAKYYILDPAYKTGGMYSSVLYAVKSIPAQVLSRENVLKDIRSFLDAHNVSQIYAYNAKFDYGHLSELCDYEWYDIMRIAAYSQFNTFIPKDAVLCKTGRLKTGFGVEDILIMISGDTTYSETHNAVLDAVDELKIIELLGVSLDKYASEGFKFLCI